MTDPTVDALLSVIHCQDTCGPDGSLIDCGECDSCEVAVALADAGYVVVRAEDVLDAERHRQAFRNVWGRTDHAATPEAWSDAVLAEYAALATKETS